MNINDIKRKAAERLAATAGSCVTVSAFLYSVISFFILCESIIYLGLRGNGYGYFYSPARVIHSRPAMIFWAAHLALDMILISMVPFILKRVMLDIATNKSVEDSRRYISAHAWALYKKSFLVNLELCFLKGFTAVPGIIGIYGINHWSRILLVDELTSVGLFCLTGSISLTCVWAILWSHYLLSLSLTPLIMTLNPRSNIFDACDLSVKIMDGRRGQYLRFLGAFLKYLPLAAMIYPLLLLYPYFYLSRLLFQLELLGPRGVDKMPGMIRRWKKYDPDAGNAKRGLGRREQENAGLTEVHPEWEM